MATEITPTTSLETNTPGAGADRFAVALVERAIVEHECASIIFEAEIAHHRFGQKLFCGLLDAQLRSGVGLCIDMERGEIVDLINGQGIIGYLNDSSPFGDPAIRLRLEVDKFGTTHICSIQINDERILYPAVLLEQTYETGAVLGSTLSRDGHAISFSNAVLTVRRNVSVAA